MTTTLWLNTCFFKLGLKKKEWLPHCDWKPAFYYRLKENDYYSVIEHTGEVLEHKPDNVKVLFLFLRRLGQKVYVMDHIKLSDNRRGGGYFWEGKQCVLKVIR